MDGRLKQVLLYVCSFQIRRDEKIGKIPSHQATGQCVEILTALKKLGDSLTPEEEAYLQANSSTSLKEFEQVSSTLGKRHIMLTRSYEPRCEKTGLRGFQPGSTQTGLCSHTRWLGA